jgi:hypothetical protein
VNQVKPKRAGAVGLSLIQKYRGGHGGFYLREPDARSGI